MSFRESYARDWYGMKGGGGGLLEYHYMDSWVLTPLPGKRTASGISAFPSTRLSRRSDTSSKRTPLWTFSGTPPSASKTFGFCVKSTSSNAQAYGLCLTDS